MGYNSNTIGSKNYLQIICIIFPGYTVYVVYLVVILIWRFGNIYWFAKFTSHHLNSHTQNELIYLPFCQIKMTPILFFKQITKYLTRQKIHLYSSYFNCIHLFRHTFMWHPWFPLLSTHTK